MGNNIITNCDINSEYIKRAYIIGGPAESLLQVKKKKKTNKNNRIPKWTLPLLVSKLHKRIIMYIDIIYVNGIPFFLSKTGELILLSVTKIKSRSGR